jgi:hypothetical protein
MNDVIYAGVTVKEVLAVLGGGLGVSIVAQVIKRVFKLDNAKVIQFLVVALSGIASGLVYVISALHSNLASVVPHAASLLGVANAMHTFIVSDADAFIGKVKVALNDEATTTQTTTSSTTTTIVTAPVNTTTSVSTPAQNTNVANF